jgi:2-dehydro-3-deoxy-D-gluconate 5-dehydrogenase
MADVTFDFSGRVALVTGAGRGLGRAITEAFVECGASVVAVTRTATSASSLGALSDRVLPICGDASDPATAAEAVGRAEASFGRLDILVNNAGELVKRAPLADWTQTEWAQIQASNLTSVFVFSQAARPLLLDAKPGVVVNLASLASLVGIPNAVAYSATKGGVALFTKALAAEWAPDGIRVNAVAPGYIETDINVDLRENEPELRDELRDRVPLGRWGVPADVVGLILFLCSEGAAYMTGAVVPVDGGVHAH